jgi:hypothetical protein
VVDVGLATRQVSACGEERTHRVDDAMVGWLLVTIACACSTGAVLYLWWADRQERKNGVKHPTGRNERR